MVRRRLTIAFGGVASAVSVVLAITLAGSIRQNEDSEVVPSIDEALGTYHGVGIGDDAAAVRRVFGQRRLATLDKEPYTPTNARIRETGGPAFLNPPCKPTTQLRGGRPRLALLRYEAVSFLLCDGTVFALMVIAGDARTSRGLSVGDELDRARHLYTGLTCAEAPSGDIGHYPYCAGAISSRRSGPRLHAWFGEDPIASLTISTTRFDGYEK
jgi:hypothetical protein